MATPKNQSVMKAFVLLQAFRRPDEWLTSSELSRRAKLPEASGYRLMQTLEGIGAVVRDSRGRYRPGMLLLTLSQDIVAEELWRAVPQARLDCLARDLNVAVHVGVFGEGMVTYVARAGKQLPGLAIQAGVQFEAYCTALGKVLLAALPEPALDAYLGDGALICLTERTISDPNALRAALDQVRMRGMASDDRETLDSLRCMAVPILNPAGEVVAAISISDAAERMSEIRQQQVRDDLLDAAEAIGARLYPGKRGRVTPIPVSIPAVKTVQLAACGGDR